jgi:phosphoserine phosphatase
MRWPHFDHIFFDCDSTLTTVEGIDALAETMGKGWRVSVLTDAAMRGEIELEEVYAKRLRTLKPTRGQITAIRQIYKQNTVADAAAVITALQSLGHQVYIISGGLAEAVIEFGLYLGVPRDHIRAVGVAYDSLSGEWWQRIDEGPNPDEKYVTYQKEELTISDGKAQIVTDLIGDQPGRSLLVGDGVSDLLASSAVDLFVGFGGVASRPRLIDEAPVFVSSASLAPLLAIAVGPAYIRLLQNTPHRPVADRAYELISDGAILFNDEQLETKFNQARIAAHKTVHPRPD